MGGKYGCGEQEVGVATGCGCKEVYRFPHTTYPYSSCMFFVLVPVLFGNYIYVLNNFSLSINKHTGNYGRPTAAI